MGSKIQTKQQKYYLKNRDKRLAEMKEYNAMKRYGISREEYDMYFEGEPLCELCTERKGTALDHCHETGQIRGVLCRPCNSALGTLGDTADSIEKVLEYIRRNK